MNKEIERLKNKRFLSRIFFIISIITSSIIFVQYESKSLAYVKLSFLLSLLNFLLLIDSFYASKIKEEESKQRKNKSRQKIY